MTVWSYGVVTTASRIYSGMLEKTLKSLEAGGFDKPRLFIDGIPIEAMPEFTSKLSVTCRNPAINIYCNFYLGLMEIFLRDPHADYYAMFQDDCLCCNGLREYLEVCEKPPMSYLNLYTRKENERSTKGWYPSNQLGKGSVALVFDHEAVMRLLQCNIWTEVPSGIKNSESWRIVDDGAIIEVMKKQGFKEYVHNPSLVFHVHSRSTLGHAREKSAIASTFPGEAFNAKTLTTKSVVETCAPKPIQAIQPPKKQISRIGLVGYCDESEFGILNRKIAENANIYRWLIKPTHPQGRLPDYVDYIICPLGVKLPEFLKTVDALLFVKRPYYNSLLDLCRSMDKYVICIPPDEEKSWFHQVDLFICLTQERHDQLKQIYHSVYFQLPSDESTWTEFDVLLKKGSTNDEGLLQPSESISS